MSKYPDSGSMSRNKRREKASQPEFTGSGEFEGREFWINAWVKEGKDGKFFSFSFKAKQPRTDAERVAAVRQGAAQHFPTDDSDFPF